MISSGAIAVIRCKLTTKTKLHPEALRTAFFGELTTPLRYAIMRNRNGAGKEMDATICRGTYLEINLHPLISSFVRMEREISPFSHFLSAIHSSTIDTRNTYKAHHRMRIRRWIKRVSLTDDLGLRVHSLPPWDGSGSHSVAEICISITVSRYSNDSCRSTNREE